MKSSIIYVNLVLIYLCSACHQKDNKRSNYEHLLVFSEDSTAAKVQVGDLVHFHYWMLNDTQLLMSSEMSGGPASLRVSAIEQLNQFERPLLWMAVGDSCIVHIKASQARAELQSWHRSFEPNDRATFIYKVLKIES